jgi:hypothetical protein
MTAEYRDSVERMSEEDLEAEMRVMLRRWDLDGGERYELSPVDALKRIYSNFDIDESYESRDVESFVKKHIARASTIYHAMFTRGMFDVTPAYKMSMQGLLRVLLYAQNTVINLTWCRVSMKPHSDDSHVDDHIIARFSPIDTEDNTPFQNLLLYLLNQAYYKNFRKHLGFCYEAIYRNGYNTHAWKSVSTIQEFIYDVTNKEMHFDQWKNLTHGRDNARAAADYLSKCKDGQFPDLVMDRHVFAFRNGVYHCKHRGEAADIFYPFDGKTQIPADLVACNFFDAEFDNFDAVDDWQDIPTPHLQSILAYQKFSKEVSRWMYVFLGRLMFDVGELDGWQVIPFLKGTGSSGKSTIVLKVARAFYNANDVGILSNNIEKKFGLSAFHEKFLFCGPEVKSDLHVEQAEFQSMVSGESLQINEKFKTAQSIEWKVPGILAGNEVPTWCDNSGSIARRVILFDFERKVTHGDMELGRKLESEMPRIIKKCAAAYLEAARKWGNQNVWNHLPGYFKNLQSEMAAATNSLENFLQSEKIVIGADLYCEWQAFIRAAQAHAKEYNFNLKIVSKDFYSGPFEKYKITLDKSKKQILRYPRNASGDPKRCFWVFGCDLAHNMEENVEADSEVGKL